MSTTRHAQAGVWKRPGRPDVGSGLNTGSIVDLGFDTSVTGWSAEPNTTLSRVTTPVQSGSAAAMLVSNAAGDIGVSTPQGTSGFVVSPGQTIQFSAYVRTSGTGRAANVTLRWYNSAGLLISSVIGTTSTNSTSYTLRTVIASVPSDGAYAQGVVNVRGTGGSGATHYVDSASFVTSVKPNAPAGFTATPLSDTSIGLAWTASTVPTGGAPVTSYQLYNGSGVLLATLGNVTSTTRTGLSPATLYSFYVVAISSSGTSEASAGSTVVTTGTAVGPQPTVTHGREITPFNTGHDAYFDTGLGRTVTDADLTVSTGLVSVSDFVAAGGTITKHWFKGGLVFDLQNVTLRACKFDGMVGGYNAGVHYTFHLDYCTIDIPGPAQDQGIYFQNYTANRCRVGGSSDGAKINGNVIITESYLRTKGQDDTDHNDGVQNVGGAGPVTVSRCNIDCRTVNGLGGPNAALFAADGFTGLMTWTDNLLAGGGYTIRCYDNGTYNVQGNDIVDGTWAFGTADRRVVPATAVAWGTERPNRVVSSAGAQVSIVSAP